MNLLTRLWYRIPRYKKNIWWNISSHIKEEIYPEIHDRVTNGYINCNLGEEVIMGKTKYGQHIYYKVVKVWRTRGSDWLYPSDAINCNLKFSRISNHKH